MKIDVVIPWVDGNDPVLKAKRRLYGDPSALSRSDVGGDTRYADLGEIHWCIRSINKFAPFINRIFIVTDGQDPHVESAIPVEIVDHHCIFSGREEFLPVFNSTAIETLIWNIPSLSEHFLLMNDDFIITKPVTEEDFFTADGKAVCYGRRRSAIWARFVYELSVLKHGYRRATFKRALIEGCRMGGMKNSFIYLVHTPRPLFKSVFQDYYRMHPEAVEANIRQRFRALGRHQVQALQYAILLRRGEAVLADPSGRLMFLLHWKGADYVKAKLASAEAKASCKFACFNSLDQASEDERKAVVEWVERTLA
ncbi:MAG: Stealth CR1 domain-containing protein [Bacteroidales bacterium]|nr:Stealth CR1 domain-containing protein [Candidatus Cryptobacteroides faecihippi]